MIFLDANFFINLFVTSNEYHERAKKIFESIKNEDLVISYLVITEIITVMNIKLKQSPSLLLKVYNDLNNDFKVFNDIDFYDKGFEILINEFNKNNARIPLFDCVYMGLMEELGIKEIVTFDKHFDLNKNIKRIS